MSNNSEPTTFTFPEDEVESIMNAYMLFDEYFPKLLPLTEHTFLALACCTIHTWAEEKEIDPLEVIDAMQKVMHDQIELERKNGGDN